MANRRPKKKENKLKKQQKAEVLEKIKIVLEAREEELEAAADIVAPEFDYEQGAKEIEAEELRDKLEEEEEAKKAKEKLIKSTSVGKYFLEKEQKKERMQAKEETMEKIKAVLKVKENELDAAAEELAPGFDYEFEGKAVALEDERGPIPDPEVDESKYPKERKSLKTSIGKYFLRDKHRKVWGLTILAFLVVTFACSLDYIFPETVHVIYQTIDTIETVDVKTRTENVGDLLAELRKEGYEISETDAVHPLEDAEVKDGMYVKVLQSIETTAKINGKEQKINLIPGTVNANLTFNNISYDENDNIKPALFTKVDENTRIVVDEVHYVTETKKEKVEAIDCVVLDPTMESGTQKETDGHDGEGVFKYTYKYVNGKKVKTKKDVKKWIVEPQDNGYVLGTARTGHTGKYKITKTFTANCSAYWMGNNCRGASGGRCVYGTVAVDRFRYPYGTLFWIEGYGFAVANDCGSAIKGDKLDLWMDSYAESCRWGRRHMTTYVLEPLDK